jgi:hypothetical protein
LPALTKKAARNGGLFYFYPKPHPRKWPAEMILDTSAIIAILRNEPDAARFAQLTATADPRRLSVANYLEAAIVHPCEP